MSDATPSVVIVRDERPAVAIARLEAELPIAEDHRRKAEEEARSANSQYTIGLVGILVGVVGLVFFWPLVFIALPGILAAVTQAAKRSRARAEVAHQTELINAWRRDLAEAKAGIGAAH